MLDKQQEHMLNETSLPGYMVFSPEEMGSIFESFANIFKSVWSSIKLLKSTLLLNLKTIVYTASNDKKFLEQARQDFNRQRQEYDDETVKNLEYFRKSFVDSKTDNLWGTGPAIMAFAVNPLGLLAYKNAVNAGGSPQAVSSDTGKIDKKPKDKASGSKISDRVRRAMDAFGFERSLSEAVEKPAAPVDPQAAKAQGQIEKETIFLRKKAKDSLELTKKHASELLESISGRLAVIKKIAEAQNFDEMIAAAEAGEKIKMGLGANALRTASKNIEADLQKQSKENSEEFKKAVSDMREKMPDIVEKDDVKAMLQFAFVTAKSTVQKQAVNAFNGLLKGARDAMGFPAVGDTSEVTKKVNDILASDPSGIGIEYLRLQQEFERKLAAGETEISTISSKKV